MTLVVKKFGGTSVGSPERIQAVAKRVAAARAQGERVALVVSAMGDTTDELLALASAVAPAASHARRRELDQLLATGEQAAVALVALALEEAGVPAISLTGPQAEILTDGAHGAARITEVRARRVRHALAEGRVPVVAGFQGLSAAQELTTLGRGGSDTTAVALAAALRATRCDIYTDVDGIYSADPRRVEGARRWERLAHREALLLALAGAAVLHPRAAALAASYRVPLRVISSLTVGPECGTCIDGEVSVEGPRILGVAAAVGSARLTVDDPAGGAAAAAGLLAALAEAGVSVEWLEEKRADGGARRLTAIVPADRADEAERAAARVLGPCARVAIERPLARVTVVGVGLSACGAAMAGALQRLARAGIEPEGMGISELGLTLYVLPDQAQPAVELLHEALFPAETLEARRPA
ncbi:MAG TPA: aspartate kinase [Longimicrobiales bacterium]